MLLEQTSSLLDKADGAAFFRHSMAVAAMAPHPR